MAPLTLLSLPAEIRLQIYRHLFVPTPAHDTMTFENVGPVALHCSHSIAELNILCVSKQVHSEVVDAWQKVLDTNTTLYIYVVLSLEILAQIKEKEMEAALEAVVGNKLFCTAHSCIIDIRLLQSNDVNWSGSYDFGNKFPPNLTTYLEDTSGAIASTLSQMPSVTKIEVAWIRYVRPDPSEAIEKTLRPLRSLGRQLKFVERDAGGFFRLKHIFHSSSSERERWPHLMIPYRKMYP
ncbi:MAG: hypothetical protein OHK93_004185 [Ramalina farinacea]|uniref:Uncharacterized protein n=1 Tax=Ramalina farinacea TaxID=258253 RepID=A0AA43QJF0_9LECA|nr:hypothetical protein [Ramalina farinacea]